MASGHVNRANRPNTWLHRPSLQREDSPCQLGAVHTWHKADILTRENQPPEEALQPAPDMRAVPAVDVTKLALEVGFLASHYTVADDEREGRQHQQQP